MRYAADASCHGLWSNNTAMECAIPAWCARGATKEPALPGSRLIDSRMGQSDEFSGGDRRDERVSQQTNNRKSNGNTQNGRSRQFFVLFHRSLHTLNASI